MQSLELNAKFLGYIFQLRRMFKNTDVAEVPDITTNPFTQAIESYLIDLRRTEISPRYPEPNPEGTYFEKLKSNHDQRPRSPRETPARNSGKKGKFALKTAS
ncbi:20895_t:CDS:2, partial [Gigaspora rosea]